MVARLELLPFDREGWLFELKWDGFRAIAEIDARSKVKLYSRKHNDFTKRFPPISEALAELKRPVILDGEDRGSGRGWLSPIRVVGASRKTTGHLGLLRV